MEISYNWKADFLEVEMVNLQERLGSLGGFIGLAFDKPIFSWSYPCDWRLC